MMQPNGAFAWVQVAAGPALVCRALEPYAAHLFTTRAWQLGTPERPSAEAGESTEAEAWAEVAKALDIDASCLVRAHQVHGKSVLVKRAGAACASTEGSSLADADVILSDDERAAVAIQTADCVPILIADTSQRVIAAAHAGWRGLALNVPAVAVEALRRELTCDPSDLVAAIGPAVGRERYEVGSDVFARFEAANFGADLIARWFTRTERVDRWHLDVGRVAADELQRAGMRSDRIHVAGLCTVASADSFCSYRRDGKNAGRMAAAIRARPIDK